MDITKAPPVDVAGPATQMDFITESPMDVATASMPAGFHVAEVKLFDMQAVTSYTITADDVVSLDGLSVEVQGRRNPLRVDLLQRETCQTILAQVHLV